MADKKTLQRIRDVLKRKGIKKAYVFGSFARGEKGYSDIDIAIEPPKGKFSIFDLVGVEQEIEDEIGKKADICIRNCIKPALLPRIKKDMKEIM